ncbi:aminoacyl-tRNA deacylase [Levilactobacillus bambusae]|uniref:Cys-tRNA(Pro)/Cys-tRNA(Cys) deacylase n=1 Tax=Levilactobacillus bambusae TaxID=2024736 RepID=A0A2V1MXS6_9LACO|nr:aminoacyl-tRNA deacylase [Levilactobacillus bambusae]PWF99850.1 Cys-tRNA(Pro) deacylase [Levilactobacillus bambusae]
MAKKSKKGRLHKTLVEQILDKNKIPYQQLVFETYTDGDVQSAVHTNDDHHVYKTLALLGNTTGPVIGVLPIDRHLDEKKLAKVSGNKKVNMIPLKDLQKTTGYEHGANTPIGIWEKSKYPIYIDEVAQDQGQIAVSSGQIGRSVILDANDLAHLVSGTFADLEAHD